MNKPEFWAVVGKPRFTCWAKHFYNDRLEAMFFVRYLKKLHGKHDGFRVARVRVTEVKRKKK